jgi:hypothetical protein
MTLLTKWFDSDVIGRDGLALSAEAVDFTEGSLIEGVARVVLNRTDTDEATSW